MSKEIVLPDRLRVLTQEMVDDHLDQVKTEQIRDFDNKDQWILMINAFLHYTHQTEITPDEALSTLLLSIEAENESEAILKRLHAFYQVDSDCITKDQLQRTYEQSGLVDWTSKIFEDHLPKKSIAKIESDKSKKPSIRITDNPEIVKKMLDKLGDIAETVALEENQQGEVSSFTLFFKDPASLSDAITQVREVYK